MVILLFKVFQIWHWRLFKIVSTHCFNNAYFLLSGTSIYSRLIMYFLYLNSRTSHFSKELCVLPLKNGISKPRFGHVVTFGTDGKVIYYNCTGAWLDLSKLIKMCVQTVWNELHENYISVKVFAKEDCWKYWTPFFIILLSFTRDTMQMSKKAKELKTS